MWNPVVATTELIAARLSTASPHQSPHHRTFLLYFWLLSCLEGNFFRLIPTSCSTAVRDLPVVWMYQRFCRFLPINISQMQPVSLSYLSLPVLLLNSYLGSHRLMSQLLQHPFPGHWQTHSCPDGVLIHNAAAEIIPQPGFLFTHPHGSFSFFISNNQLAFTFKDFSTLLLILFSIQKSTLTPEQSPGPASTHCLPTL